MAGKTLSIVDFYSQETPFAAEIRRILHNATKPHEQSNELKAVMLTSSMLSEGKSTISSLLAMTAARKEMRALIIDADLRRPVLHRNFSIEREFGLSEYLQEEITAQTVVGTAFVLLGVAGVFRDRYQKNDANGM